MRSPHAIVDYANKQFVDHDASVSVTYYYVSVHGGLVDFVHAAGLPPTDGIGGYANI